MKRPWYMRQRPAVVAGLGGLVTVVHLTYAQPWATTTAPTQPWKALASSADGTRLVAAAARAYSDLGGYAGPIFISTNAGATWIRTSAPTNNWSAVACSADGMKLVAVSAPFFYSDPTPPFSDASIYTSSDMGATWTRTSAPSNNWTSVASSADGAKLVAVTAPHGQWNGTNWSYMGDGAIYSSLDAGATWTRTSAPSNNWTCVASSADGTKLMALAGLQQMEVDSHFGDGLIYCSLDSGATWTRTSAPTNDWRSVASSADGRKWVAVAGARYGSGGEMLGLIYASTNSGATWAATTAPGNDWHAVASSADGMRLVAAAIEGNGSIYISSDCAASWIRTATPSGVWTAAVAIAADGYRVFATSSYGWICTLPYSGPWRLGDAPRKHDSWASVASSSDGTKLVAAPARGNVICTSSDSGAAWVRTTTANDRWSAVASSGDGNKLVAVGWIEDRPAHGHGLIYSSTNSGVTWMPTTAPRNSWRSVASSADGVKLVAVSGLGPAGNGMIYTSRDSGRNWRPTSAPTNRWGAVASSADGVKLLAAARVDSGWIYTSGDSGLSWTQSGVPGNYWTAVASSADGTKLAAAVSYGPIYTSGDSGLSWTQATAPNENWWCIASSADGTKLVAGAGSPNPWIYTSTNSGATWTRTDTPAATWWYGVATSADGSHIVAVSGDGYMLTLQPPALAPPQPPSPRLSIEPSGFSPGLSWLVPSSPFVLQQDSDLNPAHSQDVPNARVLDYTNLHYGATLTPSLSNGFYRLKQQ